VSDTPKAWESMEIRLAANDWRRLTYAPHGDLDWIELDTPILSIGPGPFGVLFQCADGGLRFLSSDSGQPGDPKSWRIRLLEYLR